MAVDDIDRELKRIQLMRESLALERELERRAWKANTIGVAMAGASRATTAVSGLVTGTGRLVGRWWKMAALTTLLATMAFGGFMWYQAAERAELKSAEAKFEKDREEYANAQCAKSSCSPHSYPIGYSQCIREQDECRGKARTYFWQLKQAEAMR